MSHYAWFISKRYISGRNSSYFISVASIVGISLGVAALIVVLSIMNGFQEELKRRISGLSAHLQVLPLEGRFLPKWKTAKKIADKIVNISAVSPFVQGQSLIRSDIQAHSAIVRGVVPESARKIIRSPRSSLENALKTIEKSHFGIVLGSALAHQIGAHVGDHVVVIVPQAVTNLFDDLPQMKQFQVTSVFDVGLYEYDANLAYIRLDDAQKLYQMQDGVSGLNISVNDDTHLDRTATAIDQALTEMEPQAYRIANWQKENASLFSALTLEKRVMFVILTLIIAVAAFNIVSSLIMSVIEKRNDIAILSTMGATPGAIMRLFLYQGLFLSTIGIVIGSLVGLVIASNIDIIVPFFERLLQTHFLDKNIYFLSELPSKIRGTDIITVVLTAWILSLLATIYPSWRATQIDPAAVLRD